MTLPVRVSSPDINDVVLTLPGWSDGGWLKQHPIPSDKGKYGNFEVLAQQNKRIIQQILSDDSSSVYEDVTAAADQEDPYDVLLLKKLRSMYNSCMDEDLLDARGQEPLLHIIRTVRKLFSGKTTSIENMPSAKQDDEDKEKQRKGLTAALAYLHSRGRWLFILSLISLWAHMSVGVDGLFDTMIDGDAGDDPNFMTLWFSQPNLGLPSKVGADYANYSL